MPNIICLRYILFFPGIQFRESSTSLLCLDSTLIPLVPSYSLFLFEMYSCTKEDL